VLTELYRLINYFFIADHVDESLYILIVMICEH
jgi:hypothetical protein